MLGVLLVLLILLAGQIQVLEQLQPQAEEEAELITETQMDHPVALAVVADIVALPLEVALGRRDKVTPEGTILVMPAQRMVLEVVVGRVVLEQTVVLLLVGMAAHQRAHIQHGPAQLEQEYLETTLVAVVEPELDTQELIREVLVAVVEQQQEHPQEPLLTQPLTREVVAVAVA